MEGTVSVVTGASRGIGKGIALQLAKAGSTVYITGREPHTSPPAPLAKPQGCDLTRAGP